MTQRDSVGTQEAIGHGLRLQRNYKDPLTRGYSVQLMAVLFLLIFLLFLSNVSKKVSYSV